VNIKGHTTVGGNFVVAERVVKSFNSTVAGSAAAPDVKETLRQLSEEVGKMAAHLDEKAAAQAAEDYEVLAKEAVEEEPRRRWLETAAESLEKAAKAAGAAAGPVISLVQAILKLFPG
jgi:hypothetical protein